MYSSSTAWLAPENLSISDILLKIFVTCKYLKFLMREPRRREDNNRMDLREWGGKVWTGIHLARDNDQWWGLVNTVINLQVP
jgi:hypothetical protein